jgi:hypothetical protein
VYMRMEHGLGRWHVYHHGNDHYLHFLIVKFQLVQSVVDDVAHKLDCAVALPVSTD